MAKPSGISCFFRGFACRMMLGMLLVHAVLLPTLFGGLYYLVKQDYQDQFIDHVRSDARLFADHLRHAILADSERVTDEIDNALLMGRFVYAALVEDGQVTLSKRWDGSEPQAVFAEDFFFGQHDDTIYNISLPLPGGSVTASGAQLWLGYDESHTQDHVQTVFNYAIYLAAAYLVLTFIIIGLITPFLTRPLNQLRRASHKIALGQHDAAFTPSTRLVEVAALADDLEHMRRKLLSQQQSLVTSEALLRRSHDELEHKVRQRTADLEYANEALRIARDEAVEASRLKSQFLANMSHEIRTPMNGVLGMLSLLQVTIEDETQNDYAEVALRSAQNLLTLLNDILDFSKIEAGQLQLEMTDIALRSSLNDIAILMRQNAEDKGLTFDIRIADDVPDIIRSDPTRLRQILNNLINNAIKFTAAGSVTLDVNLKREMESGPSLSFEVSDTGIGIAPSSQTHVFEAFIQEDGSITRQYGGTGLGLAICRQLVTRMGGEIGLDSVPGQGSRFYFSLPLAPTADPPLVAPDNDTRKNVYPRPPQRTGRVTTEPMQSRKRILVAEDNPANQQVIRAILNSLGYLFDITDDGAAALEAVKSRRYDLILMDCQMPVVDGYEASRRIRALEEQGQHIPIIAVTANVMENNRERCAAAGMDDFISKPFDLDDLTNKISNWTSGSFKH